MSKRRRTGRPRVALTAFVAALLTSPESAMAFHGEPLRLARRDDTNSSAGLGQSKIQLVESLLNQTANLSWEIGTHMQALLELEYPQLSVFAANSIPPETATVATQVVETAAQVVAEKESGQLSLMSDGSSGDPASIGVSVMLANYTGASVGINTANMLTAAQEEITYLLQQVPRTSDGAISHRADEVELWSDFVYMVPPFLAYYGVATGNTSIIAEAYNQCKLYRQYLRQSNGLWAHIVLGSLSDPGEWATGNAWAAAGMLRVLATIKNSPYVNLYLSQIEDLGTWSREIVVNAFALQRSTDLLFPNYFNSTNTTIFSDASSTALMAACAFRLASLNLTSAEGSIMDDTLSKADSARRAIYNHVSSSTGALSPVVDPNNYGYELFGSGVSPEAQAFVLIMEASWKAWGGDDSLVGQEQNASSSTKSAAVLISAPKLGVTTTLALLSVLAIGFTTLL